MSEVDIVESFLSDQFAADGMSPPAEAEPVVEAETPAEAPAEEAVAEEPVVEAQPRDDDGKFTAKDDVVDQRLKEKDRVIGSMAQELGDLRKLVEERIPAQQEERYDLSNAAEQILENPGLAPQAAALALKQGDSLAYEQVIRAWMQVDQFAATDYNQRKLAWESQQQMEARIAPQIQSAQELADEKALADASAALAAKHTDFGQVIAALDPDQHEMPARYSDRLASARTVAEKEGALEDIYFWAERVVGSQKQAATAAVQAEDAAASREQKQAAGVASASSAPATEGTGDPELDAFQAEILKHASPWHRPAV